MRGNIPNGETNSPVIGLIWMGRMGDAVGKQRCFSSVDFKVYDATFIYVGDLLTACQHIVIVIGLFMRQIRASVTTW